MESLELKVEGSSTDETPDACDRSLFSRAEFNYPASSEALEEERKWLTEELKMSEESSQPQPQPQPSGSDTLSCNDLSSLDHLQDDEDLNRPSVIEGYTIGHSGTNNDCIVINDNDYTSELKEDDTNNLFVGLNCNTEECYKNVQIKEDESVNNDVNTGFIYQKYITNSKTSGSFELTDQNYVRSFLENQTNLDMTSCIKDLQDSENFRLVKDHQDDNLEDLSDYKKHNADYVKSVVCNDLEKNQIHAHNRDVNPTELLNMTGNGENQTESDNSSVCHNKDLAQHFKVILIEKEYKQSAKASVRRKQSLILRTIKLSPEETNNIINIQQNDVLNNRTKHNASLDCDILFKDKTKPRAEMIYCEYCLNVFANRHRLNSHHYKKHGLEREDIMLEEKHVTTEKEEQNAADLWPPDFQKLARRVNGRKVFFCNWCSYSVSRCDSITKHVYRVHSEGRPVPQWQCEVCGKVFGDKAYLRNHAVSHERDKLFSCDVCGRAFHRQPSLKRHLLIHASENQYSCRLCDYQSSRKHLMYQHVRYHRQGRVFLCRVCGAPSFTQRAHRAHLYTHRTTRHACSLCRLGFSSRERLTSHLRRVHLALEIGVYDQQRS